MSVTLVRQAIAAATADGEVDEQEVKDVFRAAKTFLDRDEFAAIDDFHRTLAQGKVAIKGNYMAAFDRRWATTSPGDRVSEALGSAVVGAGAGFMTALGVAIALDTSVMLLSGGAAVAATPTATCLALSGGVLAGAAFGAYHGLSDD